MGQASTVTHRSGDGDKNTIVCIILTENVNPKTKHAGITEKPEIKKN